MSFWQNTEPDEKACLHVKEYTRDGYHFSCKLAPHSHNCNAQLVHIKLSTLSTHTKRKEIGYLTGSLIKRRSLSFYEVADDISAETYELATYFCEHHGKASRVQHPKLQNESPKAVYGGEFFHVDIIEVHPTLRGRDLGLSMIRMALDFLGNSWTMTVIMPNFLNDSFLRWNVNTKNQDVKWEKLTEKEVQLQAKEYRSSKIKLIRYFGRMGFTQAQKTTNGYNKLFLTSEMYYTSSGTVKPWATNGDALEQVEVFVPQSQPSHTTSNPTKARRGKNVNAVVDEDGDRALHLAAGQFNATEVKRLLVAGARLQTKNKEGNTALDVAVSKLRSWNDRSLTHRVKRIPLEIDVLPPYETISALMNQDVKEKLSDGWLSPRMRYMLSITADLEGDELREDILRYVPADACSDQRSRDKLFQGFEYCFKLLGHMLKYNRMVPTIENVNKMVNHFSIGRRAYEPFIDKGGRFEFVIDALLDITENVYVNGDDGWEYETFEEDIEALVETPLDGMFDLARFMLINRGGGVLEGRGPYELSAEDRVSCYGGRGGYDDYYGDC